MKMYLLFLVFTIAGCANLSPLEQRISSGAGIGGALACFPGAAVGAATGAILHAADRND
jgi:hypothetical protein